MRTREDSYRMHLPLNGEYDWVSYKAVETCPFCSRRAKPGDGTRYWLLIHPILQTVPEGISVRFINRLTCQVCFESIVDEETLTTTEAGTTNEFEVPVLDILEAQGPISWLKTSEGGGLPRFPGATLEAYHLYGAWEHSGAWQALSDDFQNNLASADEKVEITSKNANDGRVSVKWEMSQIPNKSGRKCDHELCLNVHGQRKAAGPSEEKGKKVRLSECSGCYQVMYCSEECQKAAWADHKDACKEYQRKRKEEDDQRKAAAQQDA